MITQQSIIKELNVKPAINPREELDSRIQSLKNYLVDNNLEGYVLGISGGQDSLLAGYMAQQAINELNKENPNDNYRFVALMLPYGEQKDHEDVIISLEFIKPSAVINFNIKSMVDSFEDTYNQVDFNGELSDFNKGNAKARARMIAHYAYSSSLGRYAVIGSDHAAEALTGFYTKYGDGGADVLPLSGLTKYQGRDMLKVIDNVPTFIFEKTPTADLLDNNPERSDEDELGVSYDDIENFLLGKTISGKAENILIHKFAISAHKRRMPVALG